MGKPPVIIGQNFALANLMVYAERVFTKEGNIYYRFPCWFQQLPNWEYIIHRTPPEDLSEFICRSGLGGDNPKIKPPER
jgi:hypothetical protein